MTWSVRHAGSPRWIAGQSTQAVINGLSAGQWDPSDEVRADGGGNWEALEAHPDFAEAAAEVEPPRSEPPDESRLDMNPLIDVSLVLLIFFILTTTYETIRKVLDMPGASAEKAAVGMTKGRLEEIKKLTIGITARLEGGKAVIKVEDQVVAADELVGRLNRLARTTLKKQILLDARGVEWGTVVQIMDAARAAGIEKTLMVTPPEVKP